MNKVVKMLAIGSLALTVTGCGSISVEVDGSIDTNKEGVINLAEYEAIDTGITYEELTETIGGECEQTGSTNMAGITQAIYTCDGENGKGTAIFTFQNDSLTLMTQTGLE